MPSILKYKSKIEKEFLERDEFLRNLLKLIIKYYRPSKVYLFGSKARGESTPDSDYDVLVVVPRRVSSIKRKKFHHKRWDAGLTTASDIIVVSRKYFEERLQVRTSLPTTVIEEGKLLYAA